MRPPCRILLHNKLNKVENSGEHSKREEDYSCIKILILNPEEQNHMRNMRRQ